MVAAALAGGVAGCIPRTTAPQAATPIAAVQGEGPTFTLSALPAYRLVPDEFLLDIPSRLLVIQVYLTTPEDSTLQFSVEDFALVLPNGNRARILDRPRALELLRRTILAQGNLDYLQRGDGDVAGGLSGYSQPRLAEIVAGNLLTQATFGAGQSLNGYVVVDTGTPLGSLEGGSVEVVVHRLSDAAPGRNAYQFAAAAQPAAGTQ